MKTIYKYKLELVDWQTIRIHEDAENLCVQLQDGEPVLYAIVDTREALEDREIIMYGTGHPMGSAGTYLGTIQEENYFTWHYFQVRQGYGS